jgi:hypothetical protein
MTLEELIRGGDYLDPPPAAAAPAPRKPAPAADPWAEFSPAPPRSAAPPSDDPWAEFTPARPSVGEDVVKSIPGGLIRGTAGLAGAPMLGSDLLMAGVDRLQQYLTGESKEEREARVSERERNVTFPGLGDKLRSKGIQEGIETITGPAYVPQTTPGKFASTAAEFVPGGMIGKVPNMLRNAALYGVIPGLASEGAGQVVEHVAGPGSAIEPWVRGGAGLVAGGGVAATQRLTSAERVLQNAARDVSPADLDAMEHVFQFAQRQGMPISRAEALQHVTEGRTGMGNLQHKVEGMGGMRDFYAERPAQTEAGARRAFDELAPAPANPSMIGPGVGSAAERTINDVEGAINQHTRPLYQAAEAQRIDPQLFSLIETDPVFQEGLKRVRNDKWIGPQIEHLPDDSVAVVDAIKKHLDEAAENLRSPTAGTARSKYSAEIIDAGKDNMVSSADLATGSGQGVVGSYEAARTTQAQLRQQYLQPLLNGPLGKIADRDITTRKAVEAVFPTNPVPQSQGEIATAMRALVQRNPWAARQLVRAHAESVFNEATQRLASGGASQTGGAKFAAVLRGNPQQAANLEASVRALPNGDDVWKGFDRFLSILEAQQRRVPPGSLTAFNAPMVENLKAGGLSTEGAKAAMSVGLKLPARAAKAIDEWNLGRNVDQLAHLLTVPEAATRFRQLLTESRGGQIGALMARLSYLAMGSSGSNGRPGDRAAGSGTASR